MTQDEITGQKLIERCNQEIENRVTTIFNLKRKEDHTEFKPEWHIINCDNDDIWEHYHSILDLDYRHIVGALAAKAHRDWEFQFEDYSNNPLHTYCYKAVIEYQSKKSEEFWFNKTEPYLNKILTPVL